MNPSCDFKIVIAGCGLSGMITALALANYNIPVTILEKRSIHDPQFCSDPRTTALNAGSKEFFSKSRIWQEIEQFFAPINDIYVVDNKSNDMLHFSSRSTQEGQVMGYMIKNNIFRQKILDLTIAHQLITIIDQAEYEAISKVDHVEIKIADKLDMIADLLIVCDSARSQIANKYFSRKIHKQYNQHALVFNVRHEKSHEYCAVEHFLPNGPFAILPLKDLHYSSIVWTIPTQLNDLLIAMDKEEFLYNVQQNFGQFLGKIEIVDELESFPLKAYIAKSMVHNRIVLAADSAHIIHPLAGQGLNQGIQDIENLVNKIIIYGIKDEALRIYEQERLRDNIRMYRITDGFNLIFSNKSKLLFYLRQVAFKILEKHTPLKALFVSYAMGKR
ncbi:MAG: FAD-dependent monooxygenase [Rickettsiaceae bacterium]|nr:FAD-dependent monooxygenase [Rickettsiaceae bacterium]